jgi:biofilm PGA synthesis N-glycosyltransferase PgaC
LSIYFNYLILFLFLLCFFIQLYYLVVVQRGLSTYKPIEEVTNGTIIPVSVIICARNESKNLQKNLLGILNQEYPDFEVVVVNDCSIDDSEDILRAFQDTHPNLKVVKIEEHPRYKTAKKFAVTLGIKATSNEHLIFTDADCVPNSNHWLSLITRHYQSPEKEIVIGFSPYERYKGFLNKLIRYETFQTALNYFSFALNGMPYMGVGRNLSYKKSLFFKGKGFAAHMHIPSGDDDLFVNQNATSDNISIEFTSDAQVLSEPKKTWKGYWNQKKRHLGAGKVYKKQHQFHLGLQAASAICFYLLFIAGLILHIEPLLLGVFFFLRLVLQLYVFYKPMKKLMSDDLLWWLIFLDPFYYIYLIAVSFTGIFNKKKVAWK